MGMPLCQPIRKLLFAERIGFSFDNSTGAKVQKEAQLPD